MCIWRGLQMFGKNLSSESGRRACLLRFLHRNFKIYCILHCMSWRWDNPLHEQVVKLRKQIFDWGISKRQSSNNRKHRCGKELCDTEIYRKVEIRGCPQCYQTAMIHLLKILNFNQFLFRFYLQKNSLKFIKYSKNI